MPLSTSQRSTSTSFSRLGGDPSSKYAAVIQLKICIQFHFSFQYYNKWLSLLGCALSVTAMFLCSWPTALITFAVVFALFLVVKYRKPGNSEKDRSKFTDSTCWFRCRGQLGFISSSSSLQNGSDYRPAIEHDGGSRQNLHSADPRHDRITQHAADLGGFRLFAVQEELADDLRSRHESTNFVHNFTLRDFFPTN